MFGSARTPAAWALQRAAVHVPEDVGGTRDTMHLNQARRRSRQQSEFRMTKKLDQDSRFRNSASSCTSRAGSAEVIADGRELCVVEVYVFRSVPLPS